MFPIQCFFLIESVVRILETGRRKYLRLYHKPFTDKAENAAEEEIMVEEFGSLSNNLKNAVRSFVESVFPDLRQKVVYAYLPIFDKIPVFSVLDQNLDGGKLYFVHSWTRGQCFWVSLAHKFRQILFLQLNNV